MKKSNSIGKIRCLFKPIIAAKSAAHQVRVEMEEELKPVTKETYLRHYKQMELEATQRRWNGQEGHIPYLEEEHILQDLLENPRGHKFNTLNSRRNALIYMYKKMGHVKMLKELYAPNFMEMLRAAAGQGMGNSREKGRMIPEQDYWLIHYKLGTMKQWGVRAQHLMFAGLGSGSRPIEWVNAQWIDEKNGILRLQTAKVKNINAWNNVPPMFFVEEDDVDKKIESTRSYIDKMSEKIDKLDISEEAKNELRRNKFHEKEVLFRDVYVEPLFRSLTGQHIENVQLFFNTYDDNYTSSDMPNDLKAKYFREVYYNSCRQAVFQACRKIFGTEKRYSPVDTRSTFSANRRSIKGNYAAAIELGNSAGGSRVAVHYAKKSLAWSKYRNWQHDTEQQDNQEQQDISYQNGSSEIESTNSDFNGQHY